MKKLIITVISLLFISLGISFAQMNVIVSLTGSVFDQITRDPISVRYEVYDTNGKIVSRGSSNASQKGYYFMTGLKPGNTYLIRFTDMKYFKEEFEINIPSTDKYEEFSRDFLVLPKEEGIELAVQVPPFEFNKSKLRAGSDFFLKSILSTLKMNNRLKFELHCYPDNALNPSENAELTSARCESLRDFLIKNEIQSDRIVMKPHTETDTKNPPPAEKRAKGKKYIGPIYLKIISI